MSDNKMFIERRPGTGDYAVRRPNSERVSVVTPTQGAAIDWAQQRGGNVFVERVRNTTQGHPDKWRRP